MLPDISNHPTQMCYIEAPFSSIDRFFCVGSSKNLVTMSSVPHEWIVQKYGGTSVGKFLPLITGEIVPRYLENYKIALVCSAVSGTEKASGTTSQLSRAIVFAGKGSLEDVQEVIQDVQDEHFRMLRSLDPNNQYPSATASAQSEIGHVCSELQRLLCNVSCDF